MRTYTIHFNPDFGQPKRVVQADTLTFDAGLPFIEFHAAGKTVALIKLSDVQHIEVGQSDKRRERSYDAALVKVSGGEQDAYASGPTPLTIRTPDSAGSWVKAHRSDYDAVRAVAIDRARELGLATVGAVTRGDLVSDVETGRTFRMWTAEVA